jgi:hypothetical protein
MATATLRPNEDIAIGWGVGATYTAIAEVVNQPSAGDGTIIACSKNDGGKEDIFGFGTVSGIDVCTQVVVWTYALRGSTEPPINHTFAIKLGSSWQATTSLNFGTSYAWKSYTFSDLSASQSDIDGLQIKFTPGTMTSSDETMSIDTVYAVITYSEIVSSILKVSGVAQASVSKVSSTALASIKAISGVSNVS